MFATLFRGLSRAYTSVELTDVYEDRGAKGRKREAKTFWVHEPVTVEVFERHLTGEMGMGVTPVTDAGTAFFGVIDIDDYVWSEKRISNLCHRIEQFKLPLLPARSKSGGVRLYLFCEESPAKLVIMYLKTCAVMLGFAGVEVFPKTENLVTERGDVGQAISLPYFDGDKTTCSGFGLSGTLPLEKFITSALSMLCTTAALRAIPGLHLENTEEFADGPPCLQGLSINGFPEGSRNNALFNIGVYLKLKHADEGPERYLDEYNLRMMQPPLDSKNVQGLLKSLKKKTYFYKCKQEPICNACNKELCLTRKYGIGSGNGESNIVLGGMTKLNLRPPIWLIEINNRRVQMETDDFTNLQRFITVCIEQLHLVPNVSLGKLRSMLQKSLDNVQVEDAPVDASLEGQCVTLFQQFLQSRPPAKVKDDIVFGSPWYDEGYVYFRGKDFMDFLDMEKFRQLDSRRVYAILREFNLAQGGESKECAQFRINDRVIRVRCVKYDKPVFTVDETQEDY